jgi:hypothetical protein
MSVSVKTRLKCFLAHRFQQLDLEVKELRYAESGDEGDPGRWGTHSLIFTKP